MGDIVIVGTDSVRGHLLGSWLAKLPCPVTYAGPQDRRAEPAATDLIVLDRLDGLTSAGTAWRDWVPSQGIPLFGLLRRAIGDQDPTAGLPPLAGFLLWPFTPELLRAHVCAVLRRTAGTRFRPLRYCDSTLALDPAARRAVVRRDVRILTEIEARLLEVLLRRAGYVVPREELARAAWGEMDRRLAGRLYVHLHALRQKVEPDPEHPRYIVSHRGAGYRFCPADST